MEYKNRIYNQLGIQYLELFILAMLLPTMADYDEGKPFLTKVIYFRFWTSWGYEYQMLMDIRQKFIWICIWEHYIVCLIVWNCP